MRCKRHRNPLLHRWSPVDPFPYSESGGFFETRPSCQSSTAKRNSGKGSFPASSSHPVTAASSPNSAESMAFANWTQRQRSQGTSTSSSLTWGCSTKGCEEISRKTSARRRDSRPERTDGRRSSRCSSVPSSNTHAAISRAWERTIHLGAEMVTPVSNTKWSGGRGRRAPSKAEARSHRYRSPGPATLAA